uniref:EF-hand domain family member D1 n=1 Tax=Apteryx owenii TaxID=8824 RepID=A0A8B9S8F0_APTOW
MGRNEPAWWQGAGKGAISLPFRVAWAWDIGPVEGRGRKKGTDSPKTGLGGGGSLWKSSDEADCSSSCWRRVVLGSLAPGSGLAPQRPPWPGERCAASLLLAGPGQGTLSVAARPHAACAGWQLGGARPRSCPAASFAAVSFASWKAPLTPIPFAPHRYDSGRDGYIDLMELKLMMEKLGAPQTHLGLKNMIKEVDEDFDGKLSFREFLLIFHKAAAGELEEDSGLMTLAKLSEIDVSIEGVKGAKNFFEAKVQALSSASKFEAEIKAEQDERKREEEERRHRRAAFRELKSAFSQ